MESMSINGTEWGSLQHWKSDDTETKFISKPYFITPARGENPFEGHTISYYSPADVVKRIHTCKSPYPNFLNLWILPFLTLWCKCSQVQSWFSLGAWTIAVLSTWCVFLHTCTIFFPSPSTLPFSSPAFVHTQSAIIPPCRRGLWPISEWQKLHQFSAIDCR